MSTTAGRHKYYEQHKQEILADLHNTGTPATRKKWSIPPSSIHSLLTRWLTQEQRAAIQHVAQGKPPQPNRPTTPGDGKLPTFPDFSGTWDSSVQVKWLEVYEKLLPAPITTNEP